MDSPEGPLPPEVEPILHSPPPINRRALVTQGLIWTGMLQVFLAGANFASMLVLVRLLSPAEFGRATAATGILAVINCFNCSYFVAQALQLHEGQEPDWAAHWSAGFYIQFALFVVCNVIASVCWILPAYHPMAGLLHVASIGLLIDCPNQISLTSLRRELNYPTLRLVQAVCTVVTVVSSISLALWGAGAFALIVGSNVLHGVPQGLYLLIVRKWRPPLHWWRWPKWRDYQQPLRFGAQLSGSAMLTAARGLFESGVLPATVGYQAVGLLNRAQVLFSTTVGRAAALLVETVYPLLPRSAGNREQFSQHATLFVQTMLLVTVPGAIFVGMEGPQLSRLLYGAKWIAADPLILPGTLFAWAVSTVLVFATVLQAQNKLRLAFLSGVVAAALCLPAILSVIAAANIYTYAWVGAAGQVIAAIVVIWLGSPSLETNWFRKTMLPPLVSGMAGFAILLMSGQWAQSLRPSVQLTVGAVLFATTLLFMMRFLFREELWAVIVHLPASHVMTVLLHL